MVTHKKLHNEELVSASLSSNSSSSPSISYLCIPLSAALHPLRFYLHAIPLWEKNKGSAE